MAYAGPGEEISDQLVDRADTAMYQAKRKGGAGHQIIDLREALQADDRNSLERDLRAAFSDGRLDVAYQPIVRSRDGLVTGVEALLRWTHEERGAVPPLVDGRRSPNRPGSSARSAPGCSNAACRDRAPLARGPPAELRSTSR